LTYPIISWSQPYSACFTVDKKRGCFPLTVTVTSCSPSGPGVGLGAPLYNYDFGNFPMASPTSTTTHTYNTPGIYIIRQAVNNGSVPQTLVYTTDTVEVLGKPNPVFSVEVCVPLLVHVSIPDTTYDSYTLDYGDGTVVTAAPNAYTTYIYSTSSSKTISVTGQYTVGTLCTGSTSTKTITPITTLTIPDIIDLTVTNQNVSTGAITIRYGGIAGRTYKIESKINNGAYSPIDTFIASTTGINTQSFSGLNTQANTYTFRMQNIDPCGNSSAYSFEITSIIVNPSALNGSNQVIFTSNGGILFSTLDLYRNAVLRQAAATSPFSDNTVFCGSDYCYKVQGTLSTMSLTSGTNLKSYSASSCVQATYTGIAPVVTNVNSTVEGNFVKVVWDKPTLNAAVPSIAFYTIYRKDGAGYFNYGSSSSNSYLDNVVSVSTQPYCYEISYKDACNNVSAISTNTCTVNLTVTRTDDLNKLSWTAYVGYQSGIKEYILENLDENGNVVLSKSVGSGTSYNEVADPSLAQIIYRIRVVPLGSENLISYSNVVKLDLTPQVFMPNVFTPNGDGDNDVLEIKGKYYKSAKMTILNKWGEVVFISEDVNVGWDGNYKGQPASVDAYSYHVVALDNTGREISLKGVVSLLR
jgi:gliding motility-associated-like protein